MSFSFRTISTFFVLFSSVAISPLEALAQSAEPNPRIALVIGNATYPDQALATTANDAGLVAQTLQAAGYDVVGARDLDEKSLRVALRDFLDKASAAGPDMQAFVYLSGRAVQYNGDNYFVPVDAHINRDADTPIDAIRLSDFTHALAQTPGRVRVVVIDGARANPYPAQGAPLAPGLALVDVEPGELIAFNAAPGTLAGDEQGPYGVYGKTLAGLMRQGGVDISAVFDQTRVLVNQQTQGALIPWDASKLDGPYFVFERAADAPPPPVLAAPDAAQQSNAPLSPDDAYSRALARDTMDGYQAFLSAYPNSDQARRVRAILAARREAAFWRRSVNENTSHAYWTYLRTYKRGPHVADARRRLAMLSAPFDPPRDFRPMAYADLPPPPPDEGFYEDRPVYVFDDFGPPPPPPPAYYDRGYDDDDWRDLPPPAPPGAIGVLPALAVAIPLAIGAMAYRDHGNREGLAPRGAAPPPPRQPQAAPRLPANIRPVAPTAPPAAAAAAPPPRAGRPVVKPLPPIAAAPPAGKPALPATATPPAGSVKPAGAPTPAAPPAPPSAAGAVNPSPLPGPGAPKLPTPAAAPLPTPAAEAPKPAPLPSPGAPKLPTPAAEPLPTPAAGALKPAVTPSPGATPLPKPADGALKPAPLPSPGAPKLPAPAGEPLPTPAAGAPKPAPLPSPGAPKLPSPAAAPLPTPAAGALKPPVNPLPSVQPLPTPAAGVLKPGAPPAAAPEAHKPAIVTPEVVKPAPSTAPKPESVIVPKPAPAAPPPAPVVHAPPPPAAPVVHAPPPPAAPPPAPAVHAPPPPAAPVVHAPPPAAPPPAPVMRAPPPPAAPPPAPVMRAPPPPAAPPPAPVVRAPPPAPAKAECGKPGQPKC